MPVHPLANHRAHDYRALVREWQALAKEAGLKMEIFARVGELPVYVLRTRDSAKDTRPTIYLSAGIHGDEPAAPWGLLAWARENVARFKEDRYLIFPVMNPHGLILNTRHDQDGTDLNRSFNATEHPLISAWHRVVAGRQIAMGICLHEDYDGQGNYLYELNPQSPVVGNKILKDCSRVLPIDQRKRIDGRAAKGGLIVRRVLPEMPGQPEAIVLHLMGAPLTLTFESPSEFSLHDRIEAQKTFIQSALEHGLRRGG